MSHRIAQQLLASSELGIQWILAQQRADGSFCDPQDGIGGYYKVPYALSLTGHHREAQRLADWIAAHHFTPQGDFRAPQRKALEPFHETWPVYANAWLIQGLHRLGRWDLSLPGVDFMLGYQASAGGFFALQGDTRYLEPVCTAWGGLAALTTGHLEAARRAGDLLVRLVRTQPDAGRFYFRMDAEGSLITAVPAGDELHYYVDAGSAQQIYYNPGIALIFLAHLYRATGEQQYLNAGRDLFTFTERCAADVYSFPPSGKLGLGCALLYAITGSMEAQRAAQRVGEYLVETQTSEGFWRLPDTGPYAAMKDRDGFEVHLDVTAEFSTFLAEIAARID
jgi:hypothetical protein